MASVRSEKVAALVKRELALLFQQQMNVLFKGIMITVTNVRMSPDMGVAKAYLSLFPPARKDEGMKIVADQTGLLRKMLGDRVAQQLRKVPELHFYVDDSLDYYEEIDRLLKK
jgi:ribosome-binding factor A